ncbi:MAG: low affinity iron permease family protein [Acidimicrobiales bacterium]
MGRLRWLRQPTSYDDERAERHHHDHERRAGVLTGDRTSLTDDEAPGRKRRIVHRTAQLGLTSRILYRIEHYSSLPIVAIAVTGLLVVLVGVGIGLGFPGRFVAAFEIVASASTLVMVFAIQHTQGREQAATQRKLDELIRALPGADESLMMLEEASSEMMLEIEEEQRDIRSMTPTTDTAKGE